MFDNRKLSVNIQCEDWSYARRRIYKDEDWSYAHIDIYKRIDIHAHYAMMQMMQ